MGVGGTWGKGKGENRATGLKKGFTAILVNCYGGAAPKPPRSPRGSRGSIFLSRSIGFMGDKGGGVD